MLGNKGKTRGRGKCLRGCREVSVRRWGCFFRILLWAGREVKLATEGKPRTGPPDKEGGLSDYSDLGEENREGNLQLGHQRS